MNSIDGIAMDCYVPIVDYSFASQCLCKALQGPLMSEKVLCSQTGSTEAQRMSDLYSIPIHSE